MTPEIFDIVAKIHKSTVYESVIRIGERFGLNKDAAMSLYNEYLSMTRAGVKHD